MSERAVINIHPLWLKNEEALIERLKQIISGDEVGPFKKDSGYAWQIDTSNDWWAELKGGTLIVAYRYGPSDKFKALIPYLEACFK